MPSVVDSEKKLEDSDEKENESESGVSTEKGSESKPVDLEQSSIEFPCVDLPFVPVE